MTRILRLKKFSKKFRKPGDRKRAYNAISVHKAASTRTAFHRFNGIPIDRKLIPELYEFR